MQPQQDSPQCLYTVHHSEQVQGPFDLDFIEAMVMSGVYAPTVLIQKVGTTSKVALSQVIQSKSGPPDPRNRAAGTVQQKRKVGGIASASDVRAINYQQVPMDHLVDNIAPSKPMSIEAKLAWGVCGAAGLFLLWFFGEVSPKKPYQPMPTAPASLSDFSQNGSPSQQTVTPQAKPVIPPLGYPPSAPIYTPAAPLTSNLPPSRLTSGFATNSPPPTPPSIATPRTASEESTQIYRDASGRMYRVPNSAYYGLLAQKTLIDSEKRSLDRQEVEINSLGAEIDQARSYLDRTNQYAVDSFNQKVNQVNEMSNSLQDAIDAYNRRVDAFNAELARVGTPMY
jgi:hypothetical protein